MKSSTLGYRPDIDGLRAVAVLSVVIFHFNKEWMPGGFVGVDIFFVISGYLITGIVAKQVALGTFSFAEFYMRRARRILPAAFFVTVATLLVGIALMLPTDASKLSQSAIASAASIANIYFWKYLDTSYFAASSDTSPLLHMWSLGVEEQFYLIWPALFLLAYKCGGKTFVILLASILSIASFWHGELLLSADPSYAYYMLPARAGELLVGGLTFLVCDAQRAVISSKIAAYVTYLGALLVSWSIFYIREADGFPGYISIVPAVGTALVIAGSAHGANLLRYILSLRGMTSIGVVSFSLYLWHWPVLALYRYSYGELSIAGSLACLTLIISLTLISYFFVEKPFRHSKSKRVMAGLGAIAASIVAVSAITIISDGVFRPFSPKGYQEMLKNVEDGTGPAYSYHYVCQVGAKPAYLNDEKCVVGEKSSRTNAFLFGDSNAAHYMGYFKVLADEYGFSIRNIEHAACPPFPGKLSQKYVAKGYQESCPAFNEMVRDQLDNYDTIIIGASWQYYAANEYFESDLRETVQQLHSTGKKLIIALRAPGFVSYDRDCARKAIKIPFASCDSRAMYADPGELSSNKIVKRVAGEFDGVKLLSVRNLICRDGVCSAYLDGKPIYYDAGHLSIPGSELLGREAIRRNLVPMDIIETLL